MYGTCSVARGWCTCSVARGAEDRVLDFALEELVLVLAVQELALSPCRRKELLVFARGRFYCCRSPLLLSRIYIYIFIFIYLVTAHVNYSHELIQFGQLGIIPRTKCHLSDLLNVPKSIVYHDWANLLVFIEWTFYTCHLEKWQPYHWEYQGHQLIVSQYIHHLIGGFDPIKIEVK